MDWLDHPASFEFVQGMLFGMCLMAFPAIVLAWASQRGWLMSRLTEKLAAAAAVAPRQASKIEARADRIIAMEPELEQMTEDSFGPHEALLDEAQKGVQDLKHALATMSNTPPLPASGDSSTTQQPGSTDASTEPGTGSDAHVGD